MPQTSPQEASVAEVVRHYADLMAHNTRMATTTNWRFAGVAPVRQPAGNASTEYSASLTWKLPFCEVGAFLNHQQRLVDVSIEPVRPSEAAHQLARYVPRPPGKLVQLGELRRVFGPGASPTEPGAAGEYFFTYQPSPTTRRLTIQAFLLSADRTDSAVVNRIAIFAASAN